jgi:hypothetical protein
MNVLELAIEALKFFENIKPGAEGLAATGTVIASSGKAALYVIQRGSKLITYLLTRTHKPTEKTAVRGKKSAPLTAKPDVAILVDINRRSMTDVATYLDEHKIDADLIIITNDPAYKSKTILLDPDDQDEWTEIVREFSTTMDGIKYNLGGARLHIFLSTPGALAFALGAVRGLVDESTIVYHWEKQTYFPVVQLSRQLRQ